VAPLSRRRHCAAPRNAALLLTCEHGGNHIPPSFRSLFERHRRLLDSHRGFDRGALPCARALAMRLGVPLIHSEVSRLLVDLNRSPHHRSLFSDITRALPRDVREAILARQYHPHRDRVEGWIRTRIGAGKIAVHIAVHSFTPVLRGRRRRADIGLLYDPARRIEARLCADWKDALTAAGLSVRRNYPYRGASDGLTRYLRSLFPPDRYVGVELEINQRLLERSDRPTLYDALAATLCDAALSLL
jgi:predicted N-formylglutamate amidohydrolase